MSTTMNNQARHALVKLLASFGQCLVDDPRRLRGLLSDECPGKKREINVLLTALELKVPTDMLKNSASLSWVVFSARLVKRLEDDAALSEEAARWAVESWALALRLLAPEDLPSSPAVGKPKQTTETVSTPDRTLPRRPTSRARSAEAATSPMGFVLKGVLPLSILLILLVGFGVFIARRWAKAPAALANNLADNSPAVLAEDIATVERAINSGKGSKGYFELNGPQKAVQWKLAAENGSPAGQYLYGRALDLGVGAPKDPRLAVEWYRKAAEKDFVLAQNNLGVCYLDGIGVAKNEAEALRWFRKAASKNFGPSQEVIGACYRDGVGVGKDPVEAVKWFRKASEQNYLVGHNSIGVCYLNGTGVAKNPVEAVKWFRKASEQNLGLATFNLAECYRHGDGVLKDEAQAVRTYQQAVEQGHAYSCYELGCCYFAGVNGNVNKVEAEKWFLQGAQRGDVSCQIRIGEWYTDDKDGPRRITEAIQWLQKAKMQALSPIGKRKTNFALSQALHKSGVEQLDRGNLAQAGQLLKDAFHLAEKLDKDFPGRFYTEDNLGGVCRSLGRYHDALGELTQAADCYQRAVNLKRGLPVMLRLAEMYEKSQGVAQDNGRANALRAEFNKYDGKGGKCFTVQAEIPGTGRRFPYHVYVFDYLAVENPLRSQELWLEDEGFVIPAEAIESFNRLYKISRENNVSFAELCEYALGTAKDGSKKK